MAELAPSDPLAGLLAGGASIAPPGAYVAATAQASPEMRAGLAAQIFGIAQRDGLWAAGYVKSSRSGITVANSRGLLASFPSVHGARRELAGIPGTPPDLRSLPPGCPFVPRCRYAAEPCRSIDMRVRPVGGSGAGHLSACPFVVPEPATGTPHPQVSAAANTAPGESRS